MVINNKSYQLVLSTYPDSETAKKTAISLVNAQYAACVNVIPKLISIYKWQEKIKYEEECLLLVKSRSDYYSLVEEMIRTQHPYDLPEIIAVPIEVGLNGYLAWIDKALSQ
ncbi:divalent-cation tolerance protein CutA [Candidatus Nitrosacidococcus tergens]|uniref:Divalent-cation tolerance protein CutA n=1 Tax=Candidatus Nitrosacidococcus tergens TaxID=553981 RepID=A0A7G1QBG7_9GAMM|nr:divalent-cation tolerance protein CutA [Candidatus Nitrosacidococcus tergens]CAB1277187.1 Divalent-cation tolerance protein CutA [Candidatus Nitrosacidococcus tergens]